MKVRFLLAVGLLLGHVMGALVPLSAGAAGSGIVISGLQYARFSQASDEFVELSNSTNQPVSLTGWQLQYRAASAGTDCSKGWSTKASVSGGVIPAGGHFLLASTGYLAPDVSFSAGLAPAGTVRLMDASKTPADALAWGAAYCGTGTAAAAPLAGQSLQRYDGAAGMHGDNALDFFVQSVPAAHSSQTAVSGAPGGGSTTPEPSLSPAPSAEPKLQLTELLVNPAAPQTDANDEFVEIYNAGAAPVQLENYAIQTGDHKVLLSAGVLAPDAYIYVTSGQSSISLTNSGGVANLLDPAGNVIDTAGAWGAAPAGSSWAYIGDVWRWTTTATPGAANVLTLAPGTESTAAGQGSGSYAAIEINELLPDPASPLTDANDEFIELFNPNENTVDLTGYVVKAGHDLASKYVIKDVTIPAAGYAVLKSGTTKLALSNGGSSVALYAPDGVQLGQTVTYPKAATGNAWARLNGTWDWTTEPSPGAENIIAPVTAAQSAAAKKSAAAAAVKAAKPKATPKASSAKAKAGTKTAKAKTGSATKPLLAATTSAGGRWLLFILAGLTLAYIIYEFRHDLRNYYYKLRGYPGAGPAPVPVPVGRSGDRAVERPGRR